MKVVDVSARELNQIVNEPDVLAAVNPTVDFLDLSWVTNTPGVLVKGCEAVSGAVLLIPYPDNSYEIHWFMPGNANLPAIKKIVDWMFERTNTEFLFGPTPASNIAARTVNRWLGGRIIGTHIDEFGRPCVTYAMSREEWASKRPAAPVLTETLN